MAYTLDRTNAVIRHLLVLLSFFHYSCSIVVSGPKKTSPAAALSRILPTSISVEPLYSAAAYWNDYVKATDTTQVCGGTSSEKCYHGGEARKAVITGVSSCSGLTAVDNLNAFTWTCEVLGGVATMRTYSLKKNKGLSDLLDADSFKDMYLTVSYLSETVSSESTKWWNNRVQNISNPDSTTGVTPRNTGGTASVEYYELANTDSYGSIYTIAQNLSLGGFQLMNNKVALVVFPGYKVTRVSTGVNNCASGATTCVVDIESLKYIWLEGEFDASASSYAVAMRFTNHSRHQNLSLTNAAIAISWDDCNQNIVKNMKIYSVTQQGFYFYGNYNRVDGLKIANSSGNHYGIKTVIANYNTFENIDISSFQGLGFQFDFYSYDNVLHNLTVNNVTLDGLQINDHARGNVILGVTSMGNGQSGVNIQATSDKNTLVNVVSASNTDYGLRVDSSSSIIIRNLVAQGDTANVRANSVTNLSINGLLKAATSAADCTLTSMTGGNLSSGGSNSCVNSDSAFSVVSSVDLANTFMGRVRSDSVNSHHADLVSPGYILRSSITDWFSFENNYRSWGPYSASAPNDYTDASNYSSCPNGNCVVWDWQLKSGDTGDAGSPVAANINSCPTSESYITHTYQSASTVSFLKDAVEIMGDNTGNDNLLCESNEVCMYMPHIGSFQGSGELVDSSCATLGNSGTIKGVSFKEYSSRY